MDAITQQTAQIVLGHRAALLGRLAIPACRLNRILLGADALLK